jgi:hypothetical protein
MKNLYRSLSTAVAFGTMAIMAQAALAKMPLATHDAVVDFPTSGKAVTKDGAWSYGYSLSRTGQFYAMPVFNPAAFRNPMLPQWEADIGPSIGDFMTMAPPGGAPGGQRPAGAPPIPKDMPDVSFPFIRKNIGTETAKIFESFQPPELLHIHPAFDDVGAGGKVRFTAPSDGSYRFSGKFAAIDDVTVDVAIIADGKQLVSENALTGRQALAPIDLVRAMKKGQTLDFWIGRGSDPRAAAGDSTGLAVKAVRTGD